MFRKTFLLGQLIFKFCIQRIVTIEDVLEELLQEAISDEFDKKEWKEEKLSLLVIHKWKRFAQRQKKGREKVNRYPADVGDVAVDTQPGAEATEVTGLLGENETRNGKTKFLGLF